jgi:DNA-binding NarL/FixJ family response regulator
MVLAEEQLAVTTFVVLTDCTLLRSGFEALAATYTDLVLAGTASATPDAEALVAATRPDVVLIDYGLADERALPLCRAITRLMPGVPVLVISGVLSDEAVRGAIEAGAQGFLYKDVETDELRTAIRSLAEGASVLDPRVTGRVIVWASQHSSDAAEDMLSAREVEVVRRVARGESNKEIAKRLGLSENTIKTYLRRAYRKLDCQTRSAAVALVARRGL